MLKTIIYKHNFIKEISKELNINNIRIKSLYIRDMLYVFIKSEKSWIDNKSMAAAYKIVLISLKRLNLNINSHLALC